MYRECGVAQVLAQMIACGLLVYASRMSHVPRHYGPSLVVARLRQHPKLEKDVDQNEEPPQQQQRVSESRLVYHPQGDGLRCLLRWKARCWSSCGSVSGPAYMFGDVGVTPRTSCARRKPVLGGPTLTSLSTGSVPLPQAFADSQHLLVLWRVWLRQTSG